jgi:hypothetical protein
MEKAGKEAKAAEEDVDYRISRANAAFDPD